MSFIIVSILRTKRN